MYQVFRLTYGSIKNGNNKKKNKIKQYILYIYLYTSRVGEIGQRMSVSLCYQNKTNFMYIRNAYFISYNFSSAQIKYRH